jgi:hypothetical protein
MTSLCDNNIESIGGLTKGPVLQMLRPPGMEKMMSGLLNYMDIPTAVFAL